MPIPSLTYTASPAGDATVYIATPSEVETGPFAKDLAAAKAVDASVLSGVAVIASASASGGRLIFSPTGPVSRDYDDVRRVGDAAAKGVKRAVAAGASSPCVYLPATVTATSSDYSQAIVVALTAALGAVYAPYSVRLFKGEAAAEKVATIYFSAEGVTEEVAVEAARVATAIEIGKRVAKDIGGGDPELMAPPKCADYCVETFTGVPRVTIAVESDSAAIGREYPLAAAVARASLHVPRHAPRVVKLTYEGDGPITKQLYLIGKGITYDTGGADIKTGGHMCGMSRDKCGAAGVAGFVRTVAALAPPGLRVVAFLGFVRNSTGSDSYVSDEIVTSRAGVRVLVVNTDAEGRMVMTDLLARAREELEAQAAAGARPATTRVHTVATLTGHAALAMGPYTALVDNGPARRAGVSAGLQAAGHLLGDECEISSLRREDYDFVAPTSSEWDVKQVNTAPSAQTRRGHQFPAAVMAIGSGFDKHGLDSEDPLAYTHVDIAGSGNGSDGNPSGTPIAAFVGHYLLGL